MQSLRKHWSSRKTKCRAIVFSRKNKGIFGRTRREGQRGQSPPSMCSWHCFYVFVPLLLDQMVWAIEQLWAVVHLWEAHWPSHGLHLGASFHHPTSSPQAWFDSSLFWLSWAWFLSNCLFSLLTLAICNSMTHHFQ